MDGECLWCLPWLMCSMYGMDGVLDPASLLIRALGVRWCSFVYELCGSGRGSSLAGDEWCQYIEY